jgi:hypothetical protein
MRYDKECRVARAFFGLYCKFWEDEGDTALWDEVIKAAADKAGKNMLKNREFLLTLLRHYKTTVMADEAQ